MKKTKYEFKCNANVALNIINEFLKVNNYKEQKTKEGLVYYQYLDAVALGSLEYEVSEGLVTIYAYLKSPKRPMPLDNSFVGCIPKKHYKDVIAPLLQELSNVQVSNTQSVEVQANISNTPNDNISNTVDNNSNVQFKSAQQGTNEKVAVIAFVLSIIGLILSFVGVTFGLIIIIIEYFFAVQGLKTKKKGLAIVAIILASLALIINTITFVTTIL